VRLDAEREAQLQRIEDAVVEVVGSAAGIGVRALRRRVSALSSDERARGLVGGLAVPRVAELALVGARVAGVAGIQGATRRVVSRCDGRRAIAGWDVAASEEAAAIAAAVVRRPAVGDDPWPSRTQTPRALHPSTMGYAHTKLAGHPISQDGYPLSLAPLASAEASSTRVTQVGAQLHAPPWQLQSTEPSHALARVKYPQPAPSAVHALPLGGTSAGQGACHVPPRH
jgi:hypothetical protein